MRDYKLKFHNHLVFLFLKNAFNQVFLTIILLNLELVYIPIAILSYNDTFMCAVCVAMVLQ